MKPTLFLISVLLLNVLTATGQKSITIDVETLKKPAKLLETSSYEDILERMIREDSTKANPDDGFNEQFAFDIVAKSKMPTQLVDMGYHPFFEGMYHAYAEHRPFVLSPDMIWLLICQGFSQHVNNNSDSLRKLFVDFGGKISLIVRDNNITLNNPDSPWPEVFPQFSAKINAEIGKGLTNTLTANFSTTTEISRVASQITLMDAFKSYFDFIVIRIGCGIPKVTIEGSPADWQKVLDKTEALRKYKLEWWVDEIEPVLKKIIAASKGNVDKRFWREMFENHHLGSCGSPTMINGWIVKFFPYKKSGKRSNLDSVAIYDNLPNELVKVDLMYEEVLASGETVKTPLELWAGFMGLTQNTSTFSLKPEIGWMIRKKGSGGSSRLLSDLKNANDHRDTTMPPPFQGIMIRVKTVPVELLQIPHIYALNIVFTNDINIPDDMAKIKIDRFDMSGIIDQTGIKRLCKMFPNTHLVINNLQYDVKGVGVEVIR